MILVVIILCLAIFGGWIFSTPYYGGEGRNWEGFIVGFIIFGAIGVGLFFITVGIMREPEPIFPAGEYTIKTMQDTNNLDGNFFLGSGRINNRPVYSCYIQDKNNMNSYRRYIFPADPQYARVEEGNIEQPYLEVVTESVGSFKWTFTTGEKLVEYVFYVPPKSITSDITLDAK